MFILLSIVFFKKNLRFQVIMARSEYCASLDADVKRRYEDKLVVIDNVDPFMFSVGDLSLDLNLLPKVEMMDLVNYLILTHSFYTGQQLKAYKSLQAYKYYESGFVQEVLAKKINSNAFVVVGKVTIFALYNIIYIIVRILKCFVNGYCNKV